MTQTLENTVQYKTIAPTHNVPRVIEAGIPWSQQPEAAKIFFTYFMRNINSMNSSNYKERSKEIQADLEKAFSNDYISSSAKRAISNNLLQSISEYSHEEMLRNKNDDREHRRRLGRLVGPYPSN